MGVFFEGIFPNDKQHLIYSVFKYYEASIIYKIVYTH